MVYKEATTGYLEYARVGTGGSNPGIKFGIGIKDLTDQLLPEETHEEGVDMMGDNTATVITITKEITSWRSRHYAYQAGWARDQVLNQPIKVSHLPGVDLPSDGLTKVLQGTALRKARIQLTLRSGKDGAEELRLCARNWCGIH